MSERGIQNGTGYVMKISIPGQGVQVIAFGTNASFSVTHSTRDVTVRETDGWRTSIPGMRDWEMEFEGLLAYRLADGSALAASQVALDDIIHFDFINRQELSIQINYTNNTTTGFWPSGTWGWGGYAYLTSVNIDAPQEDNSTFTLSFKGKNKLDQFYNP